MAKDWTGNTSLINGCNSRNVDSEENDYYATDPIAMEKLLEIHQFHKKIWEPACGEGHLSKVLEANGYDVTSTDLIDRGYGGFETLDFLTTGYKNLEEDIVTNPPYKYATEFVKKALDSVAEGYEVAMFLKFTFCTSKGRKQLFNEFPPQEILVFSERVECGKNGNFVGAKGVDYAWFIWKKGHYGPTYLRWL